MSFNYSWVNVLLLLPLASMCIFISCFIFHLVFHTPPYPFFFFCLQTFFLPMPTQLTVPCWTSRWRMWGRSWSTRRPTCWPATGRTVPAHLLSARSVHNKTWKGKSWTSLDWKLLEHYGCMCIRFPLENNNVNTPPPTADPAQRHEGVTCLHEQPDEERPLG